MRNIAHGKRFWKVSPNDNDVIVHHDNEYSDEDEEVGVGDGADDEEDMPTMAKRSGWCRIYISSNEDD